MEGKKLNIVIEDWHYTCGDRCCDMYGDTLTVNGVECEDQYAGGDVISALEFVLTQLGVEFEITRK